MNELEFLRKLKEYEGKEVLSKSLDELFSANNFKGSIMDHIQEVNPGSLIDRYSYENDNLVEIIVWFFQKTPEDEKDLILEIADITLDFL